MQRQKFNLRLPVELYRQLGSLADEYGLSKNAIALLALRNYLSYAAKYRRLPGTHEKPHNRQNMPPRVGPKPGRNDHCHCGSGTKYKRCCYPN